MMQYLASKGLDEVQATDILVTSFQNSIFRLIPQEELRQEVDQMFKTSE
jgi:Fe-S cluster assembly scaffold protein SufB